MCHRLMNKSISRCKLLPVLLHAFILGSDMCIVMHQKHGYEKVMNCITLCGCYKRFHKRSNYRVSRRTISHDNQVALP